ncbi:MAG: hypothetical protein ABSE95_06365 [Thermodesulfobacteriota bacterium]
METFKEKGKPEGEKFPLLKETPDTPLRKGFSLPVTPKDFQGLFERADAEVGVSYIPGTIEMIQEDFLKLWVEVQDAEDRINLLWLRAQEGEQDMGAFREAVDRRRSLHLKAIRLFSLIQGVN